MSENKTWYCPTCKNTWPQQDVEVPASCPLHGDVLEYGNPYDD